MIKILAASLIVLASALLSLTPAYADNNMQDNFSQQILPLDCVFTIVNNGSKQIIYVTPQACGVPIPNHNQAHQPHIQLVISKPVHMIIRPKAVADNDVSEQFSNSISANNSISTNSVNCNNDTTVSVLVCNYLSLPTTTTPDNLTLLDELNVIQGFNVVMAPNTTYGFPVVTASSNSKTDIAFHYLTVLSIDDPNNKLVAHLTITAQPHDISFILRAGQTISLAVTNNKFADVGITLNNLDAKLVSLTIWQLQPVNNTIKTAKTVAWSNQLTAIVATGAAITVLIWSIHKNWLGSKRR